MDLEGRITELNKHFFFDEFTYSKNKFQPVPKKEVELADNIIWIGRSLIVFQLKERNLSVETSEEKEAKWFSKKVLAFASRQIRDTLKYLEDNTYINIENHRGHKFDLNMSGINEIHKIICYSSNSLLPLTERTIKYKISDTSGFIHIFSAYDYQGIVETLLTPAELCEYLNFRQEVLERSGWDPSKVTEPSLIGQFLSGNFEATPNNKFYEYLSALDHKIEEWDVSGIIKNYTDRMISENHYSDYYNIVGEIAQLKRSELREFKLRFKLCMENCGGEKFVSPYRMASPRTGCGFVFIPLDEQTVKVRQQGLKNLTLGCKYDLKLDTCIGISFYPDKDGWFFVEWCYIAFEWEYDEEMDGLLKKSYPFRQVRNADLGRYSYSGE